MSLIGETIQDYRLTQIIGEGGTSTVYEGLHADGTRVAIKVLLPSIASNLVWHERFEHEFEVVAGLGHPRIVPIYQYGVEDGYVYLIQRFMESGSLQPRIDNREVTEADVVRIVADIANALDYAHDYDIIHLDVKPSNILFNDSKHANLCDFGIAHFIRENVDTIDYNNIGTIGYSAPEIWQLETLSPQTDIYSLGIMCYTLLIGHLPFENEDIVRGIKHYLSTTIPPVSHFLSGNSTHFSQLDRVLAKATAKRPAERYTSIGLFAEAFLDAFTRVSTEGLWELGGQSRRRKSKLMNKMLLGLEQEKRHDYQFETVDDVIKARTDKRHERRYQTQSMQVIGDTLAQSDYIAVDVTRAETLLSYGQFTEGNLGLLVMSMELPSPLDHQLEQAHGLMILEVEFGSQADQFGLHTGDILVKFNQTQLMSESDLPIMREAHPEPVLQIVRAGTICTLEL